MTTQSNEVIPQWTRGDRLRKARLLTGQNTRDFAETVGVSQKTINNAESDSHDVRRIVMNAWALATGVPASWLETGVEPFSGPPTTPSGDPDALRKLTDSKRGRTRTTRPHPSTHGYVSAA